jgi:hypothetical protein
MGEPVRAVSGKELVINTYPIMCFGVDCSLLLVSWLRRFAVSILKRYGEHESVKGKMDKWVRRLDDLKKVLRFSGEYSRWRSVLARVAAKAVVVSGNACSLPTVAFTMGECSFTIENVRVMLL